MNANPPYVSGLSRTFTDAVEALAYATEIYHANIAYLQDAFEHFVRGETPSHKVFACYPYVALDLDHNSQVDTRLSYGFVAKPARYSTTLTQPDIFVRYFLQQFEQLLKNHQKPLEIGVSYRPIPIHFAFQNGMYVEGGLTPERIVLLHEIFSVPDLADVNDSIANDTFVPVQEEEHPLSLFTAPRVDYSLQRLRHYTGTDPIDFQSFVIFTNYQFYVDEFVRQGQDLIDDERRRGDRAYSQMVVPEVKIGATGQASFAQMPAYHLKRADGRGITMINIGVGPSNARNISDHVAVLRPDAWIMLGHCAGLRNTQKLGDYVLAHAYVRDDHALDEEVPLWVPIPALAEIQRAIEMAVGQETGHAGYGLKSVMRTGTVVSTDNRNWEISDHKKLVERFSQSRAIALDMESAVIAANGYRFRVPYGTLLCVSDRPMHGEIKLPGMATSFYQKQVNQHLLIGLRAIDHLREHGLDTLHSRKLRSFRETAFR
ncbi:MAG: AMP nucleosidase [Alphaproteobacteria bacterium]|nr:AMP nucleosidase [Alphaproteobacteria bacterium]